MPETKKINQPALYWKLVGELYRYFGYTLRWMTSIKISKGGRFVVVINGIKDPFTEINYGSGKPVSEETMEDAKKPLVIKWYSVILRFL